MHASSSSNHEAASSNSMVAVNNSSEASRAQNRPLPNSESPRHSQLQQDVPVRRHEKSSGHSRVEPEPFGESNVQANLKSLGGGNKPIGSCREGKSKECLSDSSLTILSAKGESRFPYFYGSSEDEDVCPTCLEGNI